MAIQQLTQPIINTIPAFDATQSYTVTFSVIGGTQVVGNKIVISNNRTGTIIYQNTVSSLNFSHIIPANTLSNGVYYNAVIYTIDNAGNLSDASVGVPFYCYTQPNLTINNIPSSGVIENGTYQFQGVYSQLEGETLSSYKFILYDSSQNEISNSGLIYYATDSSLAYSFVGMSNDTSYYIELQGETVNGTELSSGLLQFTVRYIQPASFAICDLVNDCDNGYIQISSNIVAIDGKSNPSPPTYIGESEVDLTENDSWVRWNTGFSLSDNFTMRVWGRDFNDNETILTMKNLDDDDFNPNKIVMKWLETEVSQDAPLFKSNSAYELNISDAVNYDIQNIAITGNTYNDGTNNFSTGDVKNLINISDFTIDYSQQYEYVTNTNYTMNIGHFYSLGFDFNIVSSTTDLYYYVGYGDSNGYIADIISKQYVSQISGRNTISFQAPQGNDSYILYIKFVKTPILANIEVDISDIQLEYGKTSTEYQSPDVVNINITQCKQNLFNYNGISYLNASNSTYTSINNGYEIVCTTAGTDSYLDIGFSNNLQPSTTYNLSYFTSGDFDSCKLYYRVKGNTTNLTEITITNGQFTSVATQYDYTLRFYVDDTTAANLMDIWNIEISKESGVLYSNYEGTTYQLELDKPLKKVGNVADVICLKTINLLNHSTQLASVLPQTNYYFSNNTGASTTYSLICKNKEGNIISTITSTGGQITTPANCYIININLTSSEITTNKLQIELGTSFTQYLPYISSPSIIRNIDDSYQVLSTPTITMLTSSQISFLESITTTNDINNYFTNNQILGLIYLEYAYSITTQTVDNCFILLKCYNDNTVPYIIHSNYIDVPESTEKIFIWVRRVGNLFDLKIENLGAGG